MKKNKVLFLLTFIIALFISCASTKKENTESNKNIEKDNKKDNKKGTASKKMSFLGWIDVSEKEMELSMGIVTVKLKPKLGSFNYFVSNKNKKQIPVLSTSNEYTGTSVQLKVGNQVYKLISDSKTKVTAGKGEKKIYMNYEIPSVADVRIDFNFVSSEDNSNFDTLKIVYTITNTGTKKKDFSVKTIYDTTLGESSSTHFFVADDLPVKNEVMYKTMQNQKWVISKNNNASAQFLFNGGDTTEPQIVALANKVTLEKDVWEPEMFTYRAFDTVLSYNNSAIGVIWPSVMIMPGKTSKIIHYVNFATENEQPKGERYVYSQSEKTSDFSQRLIDFNDKNDENNENNENYLEHSDEKNQNYNLPLVEFNVNSLEKEKLSVEYVNKLIQRITELEKDSSIVNREEILMLNAELDYILSVLRKQ